MLKNKCMTFHFYFIFIFLRREYFWIVCTWGSGNQGGEKVDIHLGDGGEGRRGGHTRGGIERDRRESHTEGELGWNRK